MLPKLSAGTCDSTRRSGSVYISLVSMKQTIGLLTVIEAIHWTNIVSKFGTFSCAEIYLVICSNFLSFIFGLVYNCIIIPCGHAPVLHSCDSAGLVRLAQKASSTAVLLSRFLHSTSRICTPPSHEAEHWQEKVTRSQNRCETSSQVYDKITYFSLQTRRIESEVDSPSAKMKPVVCDWQRMVVGSSTFFTYWINHEVVSHIEIG